MRISCSSANKCSLKVAQYSAQMEKYQKAIEIYEQVYISYSLYFVSLMIYSGNVCYVMLCYSAHSPLGLFSG